MKLLSFRIFNYRSIIDSGWNEISPDNVTGIIGQNESGKTSILEALFSFYNGAISEDVLRSDLTLPKVSCCFDIEPKQFEKILKEKLLPEGVLKFVRSSRVICLTRIWDDDLGSRIELRGEEIIGFFNQHTESNQKYEELIQNKINKFLKKRDEAIEDREQAELMLTRETENFEKVKLLLAEAQKESKSQKKSPDKSQAEAKLNESKVLFENTREVLELKKKGLEAKRKIADGLISQARIAESSIEAGVRHIEAKEELAVAYHNLVRFQRILNTTVNEKERRGIQIELDRSNDKYVKTLQEFEYAKENYIIKKHLASKVVSGTSLTIAEREIESEKPHIESYFTREEAGNLLFGQIPEFVLFEDFSSLLPNRIDLDDILNDNRLVEGSKAARNYLIVSGLTPHFFKELNNRILKQKIENLNKEVTLDFQDFWRQNIGRQNKITINFELEHYDNTIPDKSGLPYLEFWVKDKHERLYPKQRSRGVRWFLSFYLELKSAALSESGKGKVMLIDEPALSLHARAQEDVLKVFEHIKDKIQIIYSTHSPHLIDSKKLYRLLAVQRAVEEDDTSETKIFSAKSFAAASADTLSPIYTLIGSRLSEQQFIRQENNIILENIATYYYMTTMQTLMKFDKDIFFLPAASVSNVETLVNLLLGWGLDFIVLTGGNKEGLKTNAELKKNLFRNDENLARKNLINLGKFSSIEDLFSTLDFKKYILHKRIGIPESNSEFLKENKLSRTILASNFMNEVQDKRLNFNSFDGETRENFEWLFRRLEMVIK